MDLGLELRCNANVNTQDLKSHSSWGKLILDLYTNVLQKVSLKIKGIDVFCLEPLIIKLFKLTKFTLGHLEKDLWRQRQRNSYIYYSA